MINSIKNRLRSELYAPTPLSILFNPFYIIRNGLYQSISNFAPKLNGNILDFGCGNKPYEKLFVSASNYIGVDIKVLGHEQTYKKVDFYYDGKKLPFPNESFDCVVSFEVLEHVFNLDEVLAEIHRVTKPDGQLLISIPFAWDEHGVPSDYARYTSYGMKYIIEKNGFEIIEMVKTTTYILAVFQMLAAYLSQHVLPKGRVSAKASQLIIIFPITALALFFNAVFPKRYEYFCNIVLLAKKTSCKQY